LDWVIIPKIKTPLVDPQSVIAWHEQSLSRVGSSYGRRFLMNSNDKKTRDVAKFRQELAVLRRRLRANAMRTKKLSSDTGILARKANPNLEVLKIE